MTQIEHISPPQTLGSYHIEAPIGSGGMGRVFRARHIEHTERVAAIKLLHSSFAHDPGFQARFRQEAAVIATLRHPHIVEVFETGDQDDFYYLTMELLPDGSLHSLLQQRATQPWPLALGIDLVRQAADGLAFAHARGVIHRDIKPDNLLLINGVTSDDAPFGTTLKISDFGLVQLAEGGVSTPTGMTMGTPAYLSPEQCQGLDLDGRSDIYALGVVLYEVATGYLPFEARTINDAVFKHVYAEPPTPRQIRPDIPEELEQIILCCLAKRPDDRFASATELSRALRVLLRHPTLGTPTTTSPTSVAPVVVPDMPVAVPLIYVRDRRGRTLQITEMNGDGCIIGRQSTSDLVLKSWFVAERHLQVDWDGDYVSVTDLGSRAGTLLEGHRLTPLVAQEWRHQQTVRIGPFWLTLEVPMTPSSISQPIVLPLPTPLPTLQSAHRSEPIAIVPSPASQPVRTTRPSQPPASGNLNGTTERPAPSTPATTGRASQTARRASSDGIAITIEPDRLTITPGKPVTIRATLVNLSDRVAHVTVSIEGTAPTWVPGAPPMVQLNPKDHDTVTLAINVPREPESHAGAYPIRVCAQVRGRPDDGSEAPAYLTVLPFSGLNQVIKPKRVAGWRRGNYSMLMRNEGNAPANYVLRGEDDEQVLEYLFKPERVSLEPGRLIKVKLTVQTPLVLRGRLQQHGFTIHARPEGSGEDHVATAQFVQRPLIPAWSLMAIVGFLIWLSLWLYAIPPFPQSMQQRVKYVGWSLLNPSPTPTPTRTPTPTLIPIPTDTPAPTPTPVPPTETPLPPTETPLPTTPTFTPIPTKTPRPPDQLICLPDQPNVITGIGPPNGSFLLYFGGRVVSGGTVDPTGRYTITLRIGPERAGVYPVLVRERTTQRVLQRLTCTVP